MGFAIRLIAVFTVPFIAVVGVVDYVKITFAVNVQVSV
jgi:hypothetical protein